MCIIYLEILFRFFENNKKKYVKISSENDKNDRT